MASAVKEQIVELAVGDRVFYRCPWSRELKLTENIANNVTQTEPCLFNLGVTTYVVAAWATVHKRYRASPRRYQHPTQ